MRKIDKNQSMWKFWWIIKILCLGYPSPMGKSRKIEKWQIICFDEYWFFSWNPFYIGSMIYLAKIVRALLSNKIVFVFLQKVNNSIATKLCVNLINNCKLFFKQNGARHNSMTKLCYAFLNMKINLKLVEKSNAQFWSALKWQRVFKKWMSWAGTSQ